MLSRILVHIQVAISLRNETWTLDCSLLLFSTYHFSLTAALLLLSCRHPLARDHRCPGIKTPPTNPVSSRAWEGPAHSHMPQKAHRLLKTYLKKGQKKCSFLNVTMTAKKNS